MRLLLSDSASGLLAIMVRIVDFFKDISTRGWRFKHGAGVAQRPTLLAEAPC
jgi:hypothetical protein